MNHQQINSDALEGAIRNPIQQEEVVGRALRGSVCSLPLRHTVHGRVLQGSLGKNNNRLMVWQFQRIQVVLERI